MTMSFATDTGRLVRTEGSLLSAGLLQKIAALDQTRVKFLQSDDYHQNGRRISDVVASAWNDLAGDWARFQ
ncbi:MAG: hypothetical protein Q4C47_04215, partial [Planctomycetia bacterium]|nr:hypothetical protein [Planctomycetia bacterium]